MSDDIKRLLGELLPREDATKEVNTTGDSQDIALLIARVSKIPYRNTWERKLVESAIKLYEAENRLGDVVREHRQKKRALQDIQTILDADDYERKKRVSDILNEVELNQRRKDAEMSALDREIAENKQAVENLTKKKRRIHHLDMLTN